MSIIEIIKDRKSVRSFTGELVTPQQIESIKNYITSLKPPFGAKVRIELVSTQMGDQPVKLGTYGVISGATDFLVLINEDSVIADISAGYIFEQLILHCTELGLGTCWLGGTVKRKDFTDLVGLQQGENLVAISPIGYKRKKRTFVESVMRAGAGSDNRKPFGALFFNGSLDTPLNEKDAGIYKIPLEMIRLAPSASNKQPWRIIMQNDMFHFYHRVARFSANDMGIALCHFEQTCKELNIAGHFELIPNTPSFTGIDYVMSWIPG